jgi:hypothetical protein
MTPSWSEFLEAHFPGYLLPESCRRAVSSEVAARFLERLTGRPAQLRLVRAASVLSAHIDELAAFVTSELPSWARSLSATTHVEQARWRGGFHGRLDVAATLRARHSGDPTAFVTRSRQRMFDRAEDLLVRAVCGRLLDVLLELRSANILAKYGWSARCGELESTLRALFAHTAARDVALVAVESFHVRAAALARHAAHRSAAVWHERLVRGLDHEDPAVIAQTVADGALAPLDDDTRFELAVALRIATTIEAHLGDAQPGQWTHERPLVLAGRREFARFVRRDGAAISVFYNQSVLPKGERDLGLAHYLGYRGRLRPDVTVTIAPVGEVADARSVVFEAKNSTDRAYLVRGFEETIMYRAEYARSLLTWPSAVLVASGAIVGETREGDAVVAVSWDRWLDERFVRAMLALVA